MSTADGPASAAPAAPAPRAAARGGAPRPTPRGYGVLVAGGLLVAAGAVVPSPPLVFVGTTLVVLVVAVLISLLVRRPRLSVARRFSPDRGMAGWSVVETVSVTTREGSAGRVGLRDELPWRRTRASESVPVALVPGRASSAVFRHGALPRGRHRIGPLHVDLVESFGVARRRVVAPGTAEFVVVPDVLDLGVARESRSLGDGARRQREHSLAGGEDDPVTREYRRGDPMRRVHWKASARHDELMVRQEEQHGLPSARIVLSIAGEGWSDARSGAGAAASTSDAFEWAVSVVATLGVEFGHAGSVTQLTTPQGDLVARHDPDSTAAYLDVLADVRLDEPLDRMSPPPAAREPVVAVVSSLRMREIEALGRSRGVGSSAVALVVSPTLGFRETPAPVVSDRSGADRLLAPDEVETALRDAGWRVVAASSAEPVADVVLAAGLLDG